MHVHAAEDGEEAFTREMVMAAAHTVRQLCTNKPNEGKVTSLHQNCCWHVEVQHVTGTNAHVCNSFLPYIADPVHCQLVQRSGMLTLYRLYTWWRAIDCQCTCLGVTQLASFSHLLHISPLLYNYCFVASSQA